MKNTCFTLLFLLVLSACQDSTSSNFKEFSFTEMPSSCESGGEANLFVSSSNHLYLSWVEYLNDTTDALLFSELKNKEWTTPTEIARGSDWFVNWADFPSLAVTENGQHLAAHWLAKRAEGTYDYDVHISLSADRGKNWSSSFVPHRDSIAAEHGFVTLLALDNERFFGTWLDGRFTKTATTNTEQQEAEHGHGGHGGGAMTLRAAVFDIQGRLSEEVELDHRICDCCQTDAAMTDQGLIVVYRDRIEPEVRDISIVRQVDGTWTKPQVIHPDNWTIAGCPVNGPAVAAQEHRVAVAWFTMYGEQALVKVAFSEDSGATFSSPITIDDQQPLGRVDIVFVDENKVALTWLAQKEEQGEINLVQIHIDGRVGERQILTHTSAARNSGFPILERVGEDLVLAWTAVEGDSTFVKTAILR